MGRAGSKLLLLQAPASESWETHKPSWGIAAQQKKGAPITRLGIFEDSIKMDEEEDSAETKTFGEYCPGEYLIPTLAHEFS